MQMERKESFHRDIPMTGPSSLRPFTFSTATTSLGGPNSAQVRSGSATMIENNRTKRIFCFVVELLSLLRQFNVFLIESRRLINRQMIGWESFPHAINQDGKDRKEDEQYTPGIRHRKHGAQRIHGIH